MGLGGGGADVAGVVVSVTGGRWARQIIGLVRQVQGRLGKRGLCSGCMRDGLLVGGSRSNHPSPVPAQETKRLGDPCCPRPRSFACAGSRGRVAELQDPCARPDSGPVFRANRPSSPARAVHLSPEYEVRGRDGVKSGLIVRIRPAQWRARLRGGHYCRRELSYRATTACRLTADARSSRWSVTIARRVRLRTVPLYEARTTSACTEGG